MNRTRSRTSGEPDSSSLARSSCRPARGADEETIDDEVQEVREDVLVEGVEAERGERRGRLPRSEHEQQRPVANDVEGGDEADARDDDHVGESEREPKLLGARGRVGEAA